MTALAARAPAEMPPTSPAELDELTIVRAQRGDERARRALVERYQRPVFAMLSRMLHGRPGAPIEDLAQETFLKVFRALPGFDRDGPARLSTWILTITSRLAIDELRRKRPASEPLDPAAEPASGAAADADAERHRLAALLHRAIEDLPPEYRAAFMLREYHELEYAEISESLKIDLGTVKSRLSRARAALRRALEEVYRAR